MRNLSKYIRTAVILLVIFVLFTAAVKIIDVKPIGPEGSEVGFAALNRLFMKDEVAEGWYKLTELLGYLAILIAAGFAALGGFQLIKRRSVLKVDREILILAVFYIVVMAFYVLFEKVIINYRPLIVDAAEGLEASYPSSHTVLTVCIMMSSIVMARRYIGDRQSILTGVTVVCAVICAVTVIGRLLSGVHWVTDIIGGVLLSAALVMMFAAAIEALCADGEAGYQPAHLK